MNKAEAEARFVEIILEAGGIVNHAEMDEGRKTYYEFRLKNGTIRYWTNMSDENLSRLGVK
jgi:hypothetical protein